MARSLNDIIEERKPLKLPEPQVRIATAQDANEIIALAQEAHKEEGGDFLSFDAKAVYSVILRAMAGEAVIGVIGDPGRIESCCVMTAALPWYSGCGIVEALLVYTLPDYRKSENTKTLLSWMKAQADRLGCPLQIDLPTTEHNQPKLALCERILGRPSGMAWTYKPNPDAPTEVSVPLVEVATLADEAEIRQIAQEIANEIAPFPIDESMAWPVLRRALAGEGGVIGVIRKSGQIEASIFLNISRPWFSSSEFILERWAFVRPQFRKSRNAKSLLLFAKRQADRLNAPLRIGVGSKNSIERKLSLYKRIFGVPSNNIFLYTPGM